MMHMRFYINKEKNDMFAVFGEKAALFCISSSTAYDLYRCDMDEVERDLVWRSLDFLYSSEELTTRQRIETGELVEVTPQALHEMGY